MKCPASDNKKNAAGFAWHNVRIVWKSATVSFLPHRVVIWKEMQVNSNSLMGKTITFRIYAHIE